MDRPADVASTADGGRPRRDRRGAGPPWYVESPEEIHCRARELLLAQRRGVAGGSRRRTEAIYARRRLGRAALGLHRGGVPHGHHRRHPAPHPGAHRCRRRGDVPTHHDRRRASAGALRGAHPEAVRRRAGQSRVVSLEGRTALVTGGTRGIGLAITRALRRDGARVIAIGKAKEQIEAFRREFAEDPLASVEMADVRDTDALKAVRDRLPGLDILVPNAGVNTRVQALELEDEALWEMIHTNLYGVFVTCQVFGPLLFARPGGRVVVTSSLSAIHGMNLRAAYAATKAGVSGLV